MPIPKVLVFSRKPPEEGGLTTILADEGFQVEWTDSGPAAICEALSGNLAACIIFVSRNAEREVDYIPCLYLLLPLDREEIRAVLRSAVRTPVKKRKRS